MLWAPCVAWVVGLAGRVYGRRTHKRRRSRWCGPTSAPLPHEKAGSMRLENGRWLCTWCSTEIPLPPDPDPIASLQAATGTPNRHVITVDGLDVHVCAEP